MERQRDSGNDEERERDGEREREGRERKRERKSTINYTIPISTEFHGRHMSLFSVADLCIYSCCQQLFGALLELQVKSRTVASAHEVKANGHHMTHHCRSEWTAIVTFHGQTEGWVGGVGAGTGAWAGCRGRQGNI